jgi:hypothetical protein
MMIFIKKYNYLTLIYYILAIPLLIYFNTSSDFKTGPCTPNLDILSFMLSGVFTLILVGRGTFLLIKNGKLVLFPFLLNLLALIIWLIFLFKT